MNLSLMFSFLIIMFHACFGLRGLPQETSNVQGRLCFYLLQYILFYHQDCFCRRVFLIRGFLYVLTSISLVCLWVYTFVYMYVHQVVFYYIYIYIYIYVCVYVPFAYMRYLYIVCMVACFLVQKAKIFFYWSLQYLFTCFMQINFIPNNSISACWANQY